MKPILLVLTILILLFTSYYGWRWMRILTASEYDKMLDALYKKTVPLLKVNDIKNLDAYTILDTRSIKEFKISSIPNAHFVNYENPDWEILNNLPKDQPILVYCSVGYRSERIGEQLISNGFKNIYNLYGGIFEWANHLYPLVDSSQQKTNKVHGYSPSWGKWLDKAKVEVVYD